MPSEIELKLRIPPRYVSHIQQLPLLKDCAISKPIQQVLYSIYYDSSHFVLREHRIALRIRKIGNQWVQTIKSGGTVHDGLHQHNEWEHSLAGNTPDFSQISDQHLQNFFADSQLRQSLHPVFITDFQRTALLLEPQKDFKLEFCLDKGKIIAGQLTHPICEIELELKSGNTSQLFQFSELLQKHCPFPLIPENTNKAMRGYALLTM